MNHRGELLDEQVAGEREPVASLIVGAAREPSPGRWPRRFHEQGLLGTGTITSRTSEAEHHGGARERTAYVEVESFPESGMARATGTTVADFDDNGRLVSL